MGENLLTTALAVWGAFLSTWLGAIKIIEYRRDRPIIRVQLDTLHLEFADAVRLTQTRSPRPHYARSEGDKMWLRAKVINVGRRAATVTGISLMLPRGRGFLPSGASDFPVELSEGKSYMTMWDEDQVMRDYGVTASRFIVRADHGVGRERRASAGCGSSEGCGEGDVTPTVDELEKAFGVYFVEIERCRNAGTYWALLHVVVALPDICSALESDDGRAKGWEYEKWCR